MTQTLQDRVLDALDEHEGTQSFDMQFVAGCTLTQARSALQALRKKGLVGAEQCPDGAWVWVIVFVASFAVAYALARTR